MLQLFADWRDNVSIYVELADQYKDMDPVSNVVKRNVLADHLREVIDILEQKVRIYCPYLRKATLTLASTMQGNQIASLYDLLTFKDKPVSESVVPDKVAGSRHVSAASQGRIPVRRYPSS